MPRLSDILGQPQAVDLLRRAVASSKLAQAYLFVGPEGVGKLTTALALAGALNCESAAGEGCDSCTACHKITAGSHPDVFVLVPDGQFIKIDQVRALEQHLGFPPHEGRRRVIILDGADHLNDHAANALLKSVEEPRPTTLFVLVSATTHRGAPTLVSRCQRVRFVPLSAPTIYSILERRAGAGGEAGEPEGQTSPAARRSAAALAGGSARRALRLLEGEQLATIQRTVTILLRAADSPGVVDLFEAAAEAGKDRLEVAEALDVLRTWLRDLLLVREGVDDRHLINSEHLPQLRADAARLDHRAILRRLRAVDEAQVALRGNVQPALALENLALRMRVAP